MVSLTAHPLEEGPSPGGYAPRSIRSRRRSSQRPERANPWLLARSSGSDSRSCGTVSRPATPPTHERGRFRPVEASGAFCVLVAYTDPQKI
jgi:hypothetical protein